MLFCEFPGRDSLVTSALVTVPTPSGWYSLRADFEVDYVHDNDVVLGADWCRAVGLGECATVVADPCRSRVLPPGLTWIASPSPGKCSAYFFSLALMSSRIFGRVICPVRHVLSPLILAVRSPTLDRFHRPPVAKGVCYVWLRGAYFPPM